MAAISAVEVPKARLERSLVERPAGRGAVFSLDSSQSCCWDWLEDDEWEESAMVDVVPGVVADGQSQFKCSMLACN